MVWVGRTYSEGLMSSFYRFLARFSGRRRGLVMRLGRMRLPLLPIFSLLALQTLTPFVEGCSSRSTPKPRPAVTTPRPNVTFRTDTCPQDYDTWYCNNGATCFAVKVGETEIYSCECADGYMGQRCEFKDLDGSYYPNQQRVMLETASIAGVLSMAVVVVILFIVFYVHYQHKHKHKSALCEVDGIGDLEKRAPFSRRDPSRIPLRQVPPETTKCQVVIGDSLTASLYASAARGAPPAGVQPQPPPVQPP